MFQNCMPLVGSHLEPANANRAGEAGGQKLQKDMSTIGVLAFAFKIPRGLLVMVVFFCRLFVSLALFYL